MANMNARRNPGPVTEDSPWSKAVAPMRGLGGLGGSIGLGRIGTLARFAAGAAIVLLAAGCSAPKPWVMPYERERLADPLMQFSRTALTEKHREHVHLVREAARGATGVQGGGCGCN